MTSTLVVMVVASNYRGRTTFDGHAHQSGRFRRPLFDGGRVEQHRAIRAQFSVEIILWARNHALGRLLMNILPVNACSSVLTQTKVDGTAVWGPSIHPLWPCVRR